jgi:hypothetical protein
MNWTCCAGRAKKPRAPYDSTAAAAAASGARVFPSSLLSDLLAASTGTGFGDDQVDAAAPVAGPTSSGGGTSPAWSALTAANQGPNDGPPVAAVEKRTQPSANKATTSTDDRSTTQQQTKEALADDGAAIAETTSITPRLM